MVDFCKRIGVTKSAAVIEMQVLEGSIREELNESAHRRMAVLEPLKVVLIDWPEDQVQTLEVANHPNQPEAGNRNINFTRELYIERSDFEEIPPPKFKRLIPGGEVRLRNGYVIKCEEVIKDADGNITELQCSHDDATLGKKPEGRKVKGVIHWVSASESVPASVRIYDRLFNRENPMAEEDFMQALNPDSLSTFDNARVEPSLASASPESRFQFERQGYFVVDPDSKETHPVFNRIVALRDTWTG